MASLTQWTWVWVDSRSWWWTGRPGVLQSMGLQRVRHDWVTKLNWTEMRKPRYNEGKDFFQGDSKNGWGSWGPKFSRNEAPPSPRLLQVEDGASVRVSDTDHAEVLGCQLVINWCHSSPGHCSVHHPRRHSPPLPPSSPPKGGAPSWCPEAPPAWPSASALSSPSPEILPGAGLSHLGTWLSAAPLDRIQEVREIGKGNYIFVLTHFNWDQAFPFVVGHP